MKTTTATKWLAAVAMAVVMMTGNATKPVEIVAETTRATVTVEG